MVKNDGTIFWSHLTAAVSQDTDGAPVTRITVNDITERKKMEERNRQWEQMQRQLEKVASLNRMAGAIAHHFNNQLQVVIGNLEVAIDDLPKCTDASEALSEALQASRKAANISSMLLTYRGQLSGKSAPIELSEACRQSFTLIQAAAPKGVILQADFPDSGPVISGNDSQIYQILTNLLSNAWEASGETQKAQDAIDLIVKTVSNEDIPVQNRFPVGWQPKECTYACLEVADMGSGIADNDIEKLFDPFFTTKFFDRGMGLSVVLGIVETQGGGITVESRPGIGSTFRVFLPVLAKIAPTTPVTAEKSPEIKHGGTVLLIDDDLQVRRMAKIHAHPIGISGN
jgi:signal transduction histidine kinase